MLTKTEEKVTYETSISFLLTPYKFAESPDFVAIACRLKIVAIHHSHSQVRHHHRDAYAVFSVVAHPSVLHPHAYTIKIGELSQSMDWRVFGAEWVGLVGLNEVEQRVNQPAEFHRIIPDCIDKIFRVCDVYHPRLMIAGIDKYRPPVEHAGRRCMLRTNVSLHILCFVIYSARAVKLLYFLMYFQKCTYPPRMNTTSAWVGVCVMWLTIHVCVCYVDIKYPCSWGNEAKEHTR